MIGQTRTNPNIRGSFPVMSDLRAPSSIAFVSLVTCLLVGLPSSVPLLTAPAVVLVLASLAFVSPVGVLLATVIALPFFYQPLTFGTATLASSEVLLVSAAIGSGTRLIVHIIRSPDQMQSIRDYAGRLLQSRLIWFLVVIVAAGIVSTAFAFESSARSASIRELRWTFLEPLLLVSLLILFARKPTSRMLLAGALIAAGTIAAGLAFLDVVSGGGVLADNVRRLSGPLPHPNALALFLVRPLALAAALSIVKPSWRRYTLPPLLLIGLATFGTFSRGAMIALVGLALLLAVHTSMRTRLVMLGTVVVTGMVAILLAGDRMLSAFGGGSVSLRIDIWTSAIQMIRDRPVLGYGPDQFLYAYAPRYILPTAWDERFTAHAHNLIADSWIRLGIAGAIMACVALVIVFRAALVNRPLAPVAYAATVALAAALIHGLIDNAYFGHDLAMSAWLLAWLAFDRNTDEREQVRSG